MEAEGYNSNIENRLAYEVRYLILDSLRMQRVNRERDENEGQGTDNLDPALPGRRRSSCLKMHDDPFQNSSGYS